MGFADVEECGADFLAGDFFDVLALQAEGLFVIRNGFFQRAHRNTEMVNALQHAAFLPTMEVGARISCANSLHDTV